MGTGFNPFDPDRTIPGIQDRLAALDTAVGRVNQDDGLSDSGKAGRIRKMQEAVHQDVQNDAASLLDVLGRKAERLQRAALDAEKEWMASVDPNRAAVALTVADIAVKNADWPTVQTMVEKDITLQNVAGLRAWAMVQDKLRRQYGQDERYRSAVMDVATKVSQTLDQLVPDDVKQSRQDAQAAQQAYLDAKERVDRIDFERGLQGRPPIFQSVIEPEAGLYSVTGGPGDSSGQWVIQATGSIW